MSDCIVTVRSQQEAALITKLDRLTERYNENVALSLALQAVANSKDNIIIGLENEIRTLEEKLTDPSKERELACQIEVLNQELTVARDSWNRERTELLNDINNYQTKLNGIVELLGLAPEVPAVEQKVKALPVIEFVGLRDSSDIKALVDSLLVKHGKRSIAKVTRLAMAEINKYNSLNYIPIKIFNAKMARFVMQEQQILRKAGYNV